jgi:hypothetical protein
VISAESTCFLVKKRPWTTGNVFSHWVDLSVLLSVPSFTQSFLYDQRARNTVGLFGGKGLLNNIVTNSALISHLLILR